jgi:outer membrane protein TolC
MPSFTRKTAVVLALLAFFSLRPALSSGQFVDDDDQAGKRSDDSGDTTVDTAKQTAQKLFGSGKGDLQRLTLNDCIHRALVYNPELQIADYGINTAQEKKTEASRLGYPVLDYEYYLAPAPRDVGNAIESFFSGDLTVFNKFKLGIGVPIETFGKVKVGKELADTGILAEKEKKTQKKGDIVLKIRQLYYGILLAEEARRLLDSARSGVDKQIKKREDEGGSDPTELLKLKIFRADLEKKMEEGDKKEILAREALRVQLGLDSSTRFDLASDRLRPISYRLGSYNDYKREASTQRSDLKLLEMGAQAKAQQVKLEKRLMGPNLAVGAFFEIGRAPGVTGVTTTDDFSDPFNFTRAGFGFQLKGQLDLHTGLSKVRQAKSELYKIEVQKELAQDGVDLDVKEAYLDVRNTKLDMDRAEEAGKLSRQLLFLTQSNYDIGLAEPKDLIEGLSGFLQSRGQYFESVFYFNVAVAKLEQKVGRLPE